MGLCYPHRMSNQNVTAANRTVNGANTSATTAQWCRPLVPAPIRHSDRKCRRSDASVHAIGAKSNQRQLTDTSGQISDSGKKLD